MTTMAREAQALHGGLHGIFFDAIVPEIIFHPCDGLPQTFLETDAGPPSQKLLIDNPPKVDKNALCFR